MLKAKIKHNYQNLLVAAMLAMLVVVQIFAVAHNFSYHSISNVEIAKDQSQKNHGNHNCIWCFSSNLQNQILLTATFIFIAAYFYLAFFSRIFGRTKAAYFLFSKASRAPPVKS